MNVIHRSDLDLIRLVSTGQFDKVCQFFGISAAVSQNGEITVEATGMPDHYTLDKDALESLDVNDEPDGCGKSPLRECCEQSSGRIERLSLLNILMKQAIISGQANLVKLFLSLGVDIQRYEHWEMLHWAIGSKSVATVALIIDAGVSMETSDADNIGRTPLTLAAFAQDLPVLRLLLERGFQVDQPGCGGCSALHVAATKNWTEGIRELLKAGADVLKRDGELGEIALQHLLKQQTIDVEALRLVVNATTARGDKTMTEGLLNSALSTAIQCSNAVHARYFVQMGASVHSVLCDSLPVPTLSLAVKYKSAEICEMLIASGAPPRVRYGSGKEPALWHAVANAGPASVVAVLLRAGADPDERCAFDRADMTPLAFALYMRNFASTAELLRSNADAGVAAWKNELADGWFHDCASMCPASKAKDWARALVANGLTLAGLNRLLDDNFWCNAYSDQRGAMFEARLFGRQRPSHYQWNLHHPHQQHSVEHQRRMQTASGSHFRHHFRSQTAAATAVATAADRQRSPGEEKCTIKILKNVASGVLSLKETCRAVIRSSLRQSFDRRVDEKAHALPLPAAIVSFLLLENLTLSFE